jgi:uncharacterized protein
MTTTLTTVPAPAASSSLRRMLGEHPLLAYFVLAYAFSWIVVTPAVLAVWGTLPGGFVDTFYLSAFGPTLAAFVLTGLTDGTAGVRHLLRRYLLWRVGWPWYLFVLLAPPALLVLGTSVVAGAPPSLPSLSPLLLSAYLAGFVFTLVLGGPLGEEPGWRGFALPRLQGRYGPLWGTLLLGVLWAGWHLPHFLTPAQGGGPGTSVATVLTNLATFVPSAMAMAIVFTWVFNHTRASLFIAILLHASIDKSADLQQLFPALDTARSNLAILVGVGAAALLLVVLTRGRLGHRPGQEQSLGQPHGTARGLADASPTPAVAD